MIAVQCQSTNLSNSCEITHIPIKTEVALAGLCPLLICLICENTEKTWLFNFSNGNFCMSMSVSTYENANG
jgi:hypothetical protein